MGYCRICSWLTGRPRGEIQDRDLRQLYQAGGRDSFLRLREHLHGTALEVGCGTGILFADYPDDVRVFAIEPDEDLLPLASKRASEAAARVTVVAGDAERLPFHDDAFHAAVLQLVLCTIPNPQRALEEVLRVIRPGGLVYFYEHVVSNDPVYQFIQNVTAPLVVWLTEGCHWNRDTGTLIRSMPLLIDGFDEVHLRTPFRPPLPVVRVLARRKA